VRDKLHNLINGVLIVLVFYLLVIPKGSVRLAVALSGHPLAALTCQIVKTPVDAPISLDHNDRPHYLVKGMPRDRDTGAKRDWYYTERKLIISVAHWDPNT
jgi:hypothetical protein